MLINLVSIDASWNSYRRPSLDVPSPFNFKPMTLAKTPVLKSVRVPKIPRNPPSHANGDVYYRTLGSAGVTNTSTAVFLTRSFLNHLQEHHWHSQIHCRFQLSSNTARACPEIRRLGFGGVCAIWQWQDIHYGVLTAQWP